MAIAEFSEAIKAGRAAKRAFNKEFPGQALDHEWLVGAYEIDSANKDWPDGAFDYYESAARGEI